MRRHADLDGDGLDPASGGGGGGAAVPPSALVDTGPKDTGPKDTGPVVTGPTVRFSGRGMGRTPGLVRERNAVLRRLPTTTMGRRALALLVLYALLAGAIVTRLGQVQVVGGEAYAAAGAAQRQRTVELPARRGRLYDRDGSVLALSVDSATIYGDPKAFLADPDLGPDEQPPTPREVAWQLQPIIGGDVQRIEERLTGDSRFAYLARQLDWEVGEQVMAADLHGIGVLTEPRREYPAGPLGAQVLGFTDIDGDGRFGLEAGFDELLGGRNGELAVERAPGGLSISSGLREISPAVAGTDLVLTLDREVQDAAHDAAAGAVAATGAKHASVVVLDVDSGDVLAMATAPSFDPHEPGEADASVWRNRSVMDNFEPGSVMKAITASAALEEGVVAPSEHLLVRDTIAYGDGEFTDSSPHPPEIMTFDDIIERSSNVGTITIADRLGEERLASWMHAFGIGRRPGTNLPGESAGVLRDVDDWWQTSLPTISIGHGVSTTLLQMASAYQVIANDGVAVEPRVIASTVGGDGRPVPAKAGATRTVISPQTAQQMQRMLGLVVNGERGTGTRAAVDGYDVAGKTGTARKPREDGIAGYTNTYRASFVGFAPVDDPEVVVAVMVDEPFPIYGGVVAAPVFREVMAFTLPHLRVPPSRARVDGVGDGE